MEHKISVVEEKTAKTKPGGAYLLLDLLGWIVDIAAFVFGIIFMTVGIDEGTALTGLGVALLVVSVLGLIGMIILPAVSIFYSRIRRWYLPCSVSITVP